MEERFDEKSDNNNDFEHSKCDLRGRKMGSKFTQEKRYKLTVYLPDGGKFTKTYYTIDQTQEDFRIHGKSLYKINRVYRGKSRDPSIKFEKLPMGPTKYAL